MDTEKIALWKEEYFYLQKTIEDFDSRLLTLKSWSITFSLAGIGGAFAGRSAAVFLVAGGAALLFWMLEVLWKSFQVAHQWRVTDLEKLFRDETASLPPLQITTTWNKSYSGLTLRKKIGLALWPNVWIPHIPIAALSVLLFVLTEAGVIELHAAGTST
jgi:hypothetical protein